jgi:hypothetical protein
MEEKEMPKRMLHGKLYTTRKKGKTEESMVGWGDCRFEEDGCYRMEPES